MHYFDTSFLAPLVLPESSRQIRTFVTSLPFDGLAVSHWAEVEFCSVLARDVRMGVRTEAAAHLKNAQFATLLRESFAVLLPSESDYALTKDFLCHFETGLRAPDALHLAVAANNGAEAIYTLDKTLLRAGKFLGLPVTTGIALPSYPDQADI